ncbi:hypothetical protein BS47DRAFT_1334149, partial [Hydnum rufescens UP504]
KFTEYYYTKFDTARQELHALYRGTSLLTWEDKQIVGVKGILEHLTNLPFQKVAHRITSLDAQPSSGGLLVLVTGQLLIDDNVNPLQFSQVFHLIPEGTSFYVQNDLFKLNYG